MHEENKRRKKRKGQREENKTPKSECHRLLGNIVFHFPYLCSVTVGRQLVASYLLNLFKEY